MILTNNHLKLKLISLHSFSINNTSNVAILQRLFKDNDYDFVIVRNLLIDIDNLECEWANAIQYDIESLTEATNIFINLII